MEITELVEVAVALDKWAAILLRLLLKQQVKAVMDYKVVLLAHLHIMPAAAALVAAALGVMVVVV
jgi:hypothetical protein